MRDKACCDCSAVSLLFTTSRSRFLRMVSIPRSKKRCSTSQSTTSYPVRAKTWAMPLPMVPAPITPILLISMNVLLENQGATDSLRHENESEECTRIVCQPKAAPEQYSAE